MPLSYRRWCYECYQCSCSVREKSDLFDVAWSMRLTGDCLRTIDTSFGTVFSAMWCTAYGYWLLKHHKMQLQYSVSKNSSSLSEMQTAATLKLTVFLEIKDRVIFSFWPFEFWLDHFLFSEWPKHTRIPWQPFFFSERGITAPPSDVSLLPFVLSFTVYTWSGLSPLGERYRLIACL